MNLVICAQCGTKFRPRPHGYNARYCSEKCKNKFKYAERSSKLSKSEKQTGRRVSYLEIKSHPDRYQKHLRSGRLHRKSVRTWLANYKVSKGCTDCGYNRHPAALQLDHLGRKSASISDLRSSIARLEKEIIAGECVVRCAICHAVRTWAQKNNIKYQKGLAR